MLFWLKYLGFRIERRWESHYGGLLYAKVMEMPDAEDEKFKYH